MKRKSLMALLVAAIMALSAVAVFALDNAPEEGVTATFVLVDPDATDEFEMVSDDGEIVINIINDTPIYFEDYVPATEDDDCDELTKNAREVLFGRTLSEVLDGRELHVLFCDDYFPQIARITILFVTAVHLEDENGYIGVVTLPGEIDEPIYFPEDFWDDFEFDPIVLNGELVVNGVIMEGAALPFLCEENDVVMIPLRVVAEALGYDVGWNHYLRSIQLGVGIHLFIGQYEAIVGRMAPIELQVAPVIVNGSTFVSLDFFRAVLGQYAYVFEGQVVIESESDMY